MDIKEALSQLDTLEDSHWTEDGAPRVDEVSRIMNEKVTREMILNAAPSFSRSNTELDEEPENPDEVDDSKPQEETEEFDEDFSILDTYIQGEPLPEREFISFLNEVPAASLNSLEEVLVEQLSAAEEAMSKATDLKNRVKQSLAYTRMRIKAEIPDVSNQDAIRAFIKSQSEMRGVRFETTKKLLAGIKMSTLDPRSAIDRAMARKTGRGATRPNRGKM